mgnify:FL=1
MAKIKFITALATAILFNCVCQTLQAQTTDEQLTQTILHLDSMFWKSYNDCNTIESGKYFTNDVEFYHDKGGITLGMENLVASLKNNLCSNENVRVRREAVPGTVHVYPMKSSNAIYGAVISGEHYFYVTEKGKPEKREGLAKFTQLRILKAKAWKMTGILRFDHGTAPTASR